MINAITLELRQNSQNNEKNTTNITISASITWGGGSYDAIGKPLTLYLDGVRADYVANATFNVKAATYGAEVFYTYTADIPHDYTGEKTLKCTLVYATTLLGGTRTAEASWTLTPIPRASLIAATDANIGAVSSITVTRRSAAYTHEVAFSFGALSGWLTAEGTVWDTPQRLTATSIPFAIPQSFYDQLTDAPAALCHLTCTTYSGNVQIGASQSCAFTVTAAPLEAGPIVTGRVEDCNPATLALTGDKNTLVRYCSDALCTVTAQARQGAALVRTTIGGREVTQPTCILEAIDTDTVTFTATDSRGYTAACRAVFPLVPYVPLTAHVTARRTDPTSGGVTLTVRGNFFSGSFGAADNALTVTCRAGERAIQLTPEAEGDAFSAEVTLEGFDYRSSHSFRVTLSDALQTVERTVTVGKGIPVFHWGENDFVFHVPVTLEQGFTAGGKGLLDLVYPVGSVYMSAAATDPGTVFGGTWTAVENGLGLQLWKRIA